jgi:hypothetical protein
VEINMDIVGIEAGRATIVVGLDTVLMLQGAVSEALEAVAESEFQTRTGYTKSEMRALWERLDDLAVGVRRD